MKAVDPALSHAQAQTSLLLGASDGDDEDYDETDRCNGVPPEVTWPKDRVINGQEVIPVNGTAQYCNGLAVNGKTKVINGGLESGGKVVHENGYENSKLNGGLEAVEKVVENGHDRKVLVNGNSNINGEGKVVENGQEIRVLVNGSSKMNGGLESDGKVVENGQERRVLVNGSSKMNGGLESDGKVLENGQERRVLVNGGSKMNGGLESGENVVENGQERRVQVNGGAKMNGGLESDGKVVENGQERRVQVNGGAKINGGLESDGKVLENGQERRVQVNGGAKMNGGLESGEKVVENGQERRVQVNGGAKMNGVLECGEKVAENGQETRVQVNGGAKMNGGLECGENGHDRRAQVNGVTNGALECGENGHDRRAQANGVTNGGLECGDVSEWDRTVAEMKEHAFARLQDELKKAHQELKLRDEEVTRLSRIRQDVEAELEDLTASLFQEAHNMVREANVKQAAAERAHKESQMQVDVLVAEVSALKTLVLTSTPSRPNPHLHPQIDLRGNRTKDDSSVGATSIFNKKHRRSPSHFNLKYGRENSPPDSPVKEQQPLPVDPLNCKEGWEVDPDVHRELTAWKLNPRLDKSDPFISRIYNEEINLCLDFPNKELSALVRKAVESGNIFIEAVSDKTKTVFPKKCALLEVPRQCHYRMKFGDQEQWYSMSQICRNRIIAVCDFLNYLQYIERGLVKSSAHDVYWEITRLRKDMVLARLGLALQS